jgi:integrase
LAGFLKAGRRCQRRLLSQADDVQRLLASIDRRSAIGRRHYAMLLLLAVYGLRAGEVVELRIDDVDWRARVIHVRRSKTGRPLALPLTTAVGQALVAYLRRGRPRTDAREIFVRHDGKPVAFRKSSSVYAVGSTRVLTTVCSSCGLFVMMPRAPFRMYSVIEDVLSRVQM